VTPLQADSDKIGRFSFTKTAFDSRISYMETHRRKKAVSKIRVLLVDDQQLFSENMKIMLETMTDEIKIVGIATNGSEALQAVEKSTPDLILMDVRMPVMDGVEATKILHEKYPDVKIVMLTTFLDDTYVEDALRFGASGYILKNIRSEDLIASLRAVSRGAGLFSPDILKKLVRRLDANPEKPGQETEAEHEYKEIISRLGDRDKEILKLVAKGYNNRKIADALFISEPTVRNYISRIYAKFGSKDRLHIMSISRRVYIEEE
jgi:DNA-binding NarL/FixJ family response regulator